MAKRHRLMKQLSLDDLIQMGILSFENAHDLVGDAQILYTNERWPRVMFLCCIAQEELAKACLSLGAAAKSRLGEFDADAQERYRIRFEDHRSKSATMEAVFHAFCTPTPLPEIVQRMKENEVRLRDRNASLSSSEATEVVKLCSLYADFSPNDVPLAPGQIFNAERVDSMLKETWVVVNLFEDNVRPLF